MIVTTIPKKSRYIETANVCTAPLNGSGLYDFSVAGNQNQVVLKVRPGTTYLLERFSVAGNVSEEVFLNSFQVAPLLTLKTLINTEIVWEKPIAILGYKKNVDVATYVVSNKEGESLTLSLSGILKQISDTVGLTSLILTIQFDVFAVDTREFSLLYKKDDLKNA